MPNFSCPTCKSPFSPIIVDSKFECPNCHTLFGLFDKEGKKVARIILESKKHVEISPAPKIKCPYCAEWIMKDAIVCKHCDRDIPDEEDVEEERLEKEKNFKIRIWVISLIFIFSIICLLIGVFQFNRSNSSSQSAHSGLGVKVEKIQAVFEHEGFTFERKIIDSKPSLYGTSKDKSVNLLLSSADGNLSGAVMLIDISKIDDVNIIAKYMKIMSDEIVPGWWDGKWVSNQISNFKSLEENTGYTVQGNTLITIITYPTKGLMTLSFTPKN